MTRTLAAAVVALACAGLAAHQAPPAQPAPPQASPSRTIPRPPSALPTVPEGFVVTPYVEDIPGARWMAWAPNGDLFVTTGRTGCPGLTAHDVHVLRDTNGDGKPDARAVYVQGLPSPFGMAFHDGYLYVGLVNGVVRYPYQPGDLKPRGAYQTVAELPMPTGCHWTRNLIFSRDGKKLYVAMGAESNNNEGEDPRRAAINEYNPDGTGHRIFASGLRNPVGLAWYPGTDVLWTSVNERDGLGDLMPPDYVTAVKEGGFYGWPYSFIGGNVDPAHVGKRPDLVRTALVPDILVRAHSAPLGLLFYTATQFPERYRNGLFVAIHGPGRRSAPTGYKVMFRPFRNGRPAGHLEDFMTGFFDPSLHPTLPWGSPVGVFTAPDGSLLVTDDGSGVIWKVSSASRLPAAQATAAASPLTQINRTNVRQLQVAWTYDAKDSSNGSEMQSTPVVRDGVLYATTAKLNVVALDAASGREIWRFNPGGAEAAQSRFRNRGVTLHRDRLFVTYRNYLWALDRKTGRPIQSFGDDGRVDLRQGFERPVERISISSSSPGVIFEDMIIFGSTVSESLPSAPGDIRAFDVATGRLRWSFHTIPHPGEFGYETWPPDAWQHTGGANAWAGLTIDTKNAIVFAATGSAALDYYGGDRAGDNLFANSLLALDARTGRRVWHFQGVRHDVWDMDFPAPPTLVTVTRRGRSIEAVAQITKQGYTYVFNRRTGEALFPIRYRDIPASTVPGEKLARSQPYPIAPPPFTRQTLTEDMLTTRTPDAHAAVLAQFRKLNAGTMYLPQSLEGTIVFPGFNGGGEWGGAAFDAESSTLYVNSNEMPWLVKLAPNNDTWLYKGRCSACHGDDRNGTALAPSLRGVMQRRTREQVTTVIRQGSGTMPAFPDVSARSLNDLLDFLVTGVDRAADADGGQDPTRLAYRADGISIWRDPDGYPPIQPPWGTLNAIDLNAGTIRWQVPLGEYPELAATGLKNTGSDNYGGPIVTAGGLIFIAATDYDKKIRAFDKATGTLLWEAALPAAGNATPAIYDVDGRQYVVITCGGGKWGAPSGSSIVAFALPVETTTNVRHLGFGRLTTAIHVSSPR